MPSRDGRAKARWLRENDPVHWDAKSDFWLVTRHADVVTVSKNPTRFSSVPKGPWHAFDGSGISIQALDGREHLAKRRIVRGLFTPRMVQRLEDLALAVADEAIDAVLPQGGCEFVDALAVPVPMRVIAEMVGVAGHDLERFRRWSDEMIFGSNTVGEGPARHRQSEAMGSFMALFREEIAERRRAPRDDILTGLVQAADEGRLRRAPESEKLGEDELLFFGPSLIPTAVDEILRWTTLVRAMRRGRSCPSSSDATGGLPRARKPEPLRAVVLGPSRVP